MPFNKPRVNLPRYHLISPTPHKCDAGALPPDCHPAPAVTGGTRAGLLSPGFLQQIYRATSAAFHCGAFQPAAFLLYQFAGCLLLPEFCWADYTVEFRASQALAPPQPCAHEVSLRGGQFLSAEAVSSPITLLSLLSFYFSITTVHVPSIVEY